MVAHGRKHLGQVAELGQSAVSLAAGWMGRNTRGSPLLAPAKGGPRSEVSQWGTNFPCVGVDFGSSAPVKFLPCGTVPSLLRPQSFKLLNGSFSSLFPLHP